METRFIVYTRSSNTGYYSAYYTETGLENKYMYHVFEAMVGVYKSKEKALDRISKSPEALSYVEIEWEV